jgi:Holliday junction resolvase-like predicted endonuclease
MMNKRDLGERKEDEAARFLLLQGLKIKEHGFVCRFGEE